MTHTRNKNGPTSTHSTPNKTKQTHSYVIKTTLKNDNTKNLYLENTNKNTTPQEIQTKTIFRKKQRGDKTNIKNESHIKPKIRNLSSHKLNKD